VTATVVAGDFTAADIPWERRPREVDPIGCPQCGREACADHLPATATAPRINGWRVLDDVEIDTLPDPEFSIEGALQRRGLAVIYGPPGSCKTTLEAGLAVSTATGRNWFGHRVLHVGPTVYVAADDVPGWKVRLSAAKRAAGFEATQVIGCYTFPDVLDLRDSGQIDRFVRFARECKVLFETVTYDTFAASTPGASENSSEDMTAAMVNAQKVRDALDVGVRIIHHSNASGTRERGHSAMRGAADTMLAVTPVDDTIHIECSKQRNGAPFAPIIAKLVTMDGGGCVLRATADVLDSSALTTIQEKVLRVLRGFSDDGASKSEWQRASLDVNERSFHRAAAVLEEKLHLVQRVGGKFRIVGVAI
jgi:hypothetical protein